MKQLTILLLIFMFSILGHAISPSDFKKLAHEMVNDLEKAYGPKFIEQDVTFDLAAFHKLIDETHIESVNEPIANRFFDPDLKTWINETVDAINYFPNQKHIEYYEKNWDAWAQKKSWSEIKFLIFHEFVPAFTKKPDRERQFDRRLQSIYKKSYSFADIRPGFYSALRTKDPFYKMITNFLVYYISYTPDTNMLTIEQVENPLNKVWCLDCYTSPPFIYQPETPYNFVSKIDIESKQYGLKGLFPNASQKVGTQGYAYVQVFNEKTLGLGVIDETYPSALHDFVSQKNLDTKILLLTRMTNVEKLNWTGPKKIPLVNFNFAQSASKCESKIETLSRDLIQLCQQVAIEGRIEIVSAECKAENLFSQRLEQLPQYSQYGCAWLAQLNALTSSTFYPLGFQDYHEKLRHWELLKNQHLQTDQLLK